MLDWIVAAAIAASPAVAGAAVAKVRATIAGACGVSPAVRVAWDDFGDDKGGAEALAASGLSFLGIAFATVCKDAALKGEIGKRVKSVVLRQAYGATEPILYMEKGTLCVEYLWAAGEPAPDAAFVAAELADRLRGGQPEEP